MKVKSQQDKKGKRSICVVDEQRPINNLKAPGDVLLRPPVSSDQRRPAEELCTLAAAVIDNFGAVNVLPTDKFGAVHWYNNQSSSFGSTYSQRFETAEESIGSINVQGDNKKLLEDVRGKYHLTESGSFSVNESGWGRNNPLHSTSAGTSNPCSSRVYDGSYSNSITHICPLDEQTPDDKNENDEDGGNESGGPPLKRFCASSRYVSSFFNFFNFFSFSSVSTLAMVSACSLPKLIKYAVSFEALKVVEVCQSLIMYDWLICEASWS